jgi:uroporphyrinogen-III synthase
LRRIWITRALPGAESTAERVRGLGFEAIVAPVLKLRDLPGRIDLAGVGALAFTSANAVRAFAARSKRRDLPVFAVGEATAGAARLAGFAEVVSADGDVAALARLIARRATAPGGVVLHPGAAEPAGDISAALEDVAIDVRTVSLYETVAAEVPTAVLEGLGAIEGVLVHSPKAGRRLVEILGARPAPHLIAYCLSPEVCAPLESLDIGRVLAAPLPTEDALLSLMA